jgi:tetratricopeptide (TPR) repeat protein
MKICPLITQAFVIDEKDLLTREADSADLEENGKTEDRETEDTGSKEDSGIIELGYGETEEENDEVSGDDDDSPGKNVDPPSQGDREVRFTAKSYRGEVTCLGGLCRFHDDDTGECRLESALQKEHGRESEGSDELKSVVVDVEKIWEFQQKSTSEILGLFKEREEKNDKLLKGLKKTFDDKWKKIEKDIITAVAKGSGDVGEILDEIKEEIDTKISSSEERIENFRKEVTDWREILGKNLDAVESELESNKEIISDLSENHSEIIKLIEMQKQNLEDEGHKRQLAEAKRINNAGVVAYHNGHYEKALELFEKCIGIDPEFTEGYNNLGLAYTELNEETKATDAFKKAIELNPDLAVTYNNLGYVFYRLGSLEEAVDMYKEAIGRSKDNSSAHTNLGNAYYKLDRIEEAIEAWKRAVEIDPGNEKARRNLKRFHLETAAEA